MPFNEELPLDCMEKPIIDQKYEFQKGQALDKHQLDRYEKFFKKSKTEKIRKIVINFNPFLKNIKPLDPLIIAIKSLTKSFIGELIEFSKQLMNEFEENVDWKKAPLSKKMIKYASKLNLLRIKNCRTKQKSN